MPKIATTWTGFNSGEVSPRGLRRADLDTLRRAGKSFFNVIPGVQGSIEPRPGTRYYNSIANGKRLIGFQASISARYILAFSDSLISVYREGALRTTIPSPWSVTQLSDIYWEQSNDVLYIVHPDVEPRAISRTSDTAWIISTIPWEIEVDGRKNQPHFKYEADTVALTLSATTGAGVTVTAVGGYPFHVDHAGTRFRRRSASNTAYHEFQITAVPGAGATENPSKPGWYDKATCTMIETGTDIAIATNDWTEQAFNPVRGYPLTVSFHGSRLVFGGARSSTDTRWLSTSSNIYSFRTAADDGTVTADHAMTLSPTAKDLQEIRGLLTLPQGLSTNYNLSEELLKAQDGSSTFGPLNVDRQKQASWGMEKGTRPELVGSSGVFIQKGGRTVRELSYDFIDNVFRARDIGILAEHILVKRAKRIVYVRGVETQVWILLRDGSLASITIETDQKVFAWAHHTITDGFVVDIATLQDDDEHDQLWMLVDRNGSVHLEAMQSPWRETEDIATNALYMDSAIFGATETPQTIWSGLDHLEGKTVQILADGVFVGTSVVEGGTIITKAATKVWAGLKIVREFELGPLFVVTDLVSSLYENKRVIKARFASRLLHSLAVGVDTLLPAELRYGSDQEFEVKIRDHFGRFKTIKGRTEDPYPWFIDAVSVDWEFGS